MMNRVAWLLHVAALCWAASALAGPPEEVTMARFRVLDAKRVEYSGTDVVSEASLLPHAPCADWVDDFDSVVVLVGKSIEVLISRRMGGPTLSDIYHAWIRDTDEAYVHVVLEVQNTGVDIRVKPKRSGQSDEMGCRVENGEAPVIQAVSPCGPRMRLFPVVLSHQKGEGLMVGSGVWDGEYVFTASHVASSMGRLDVWGWKDKRWNLIRKDVLFACGRSWCVGELRLEPNGFEAWQPDSEGAPVLLITHPGEPPRRVRAPKSALGGYLLYEDLRSVPHVHAGASGSAYAWWDGRSWHLVGLLVGGGYQEAVTGGPHFFLYYTSVCDGVKEN